MGTWKNRQNCASLETSPIKIPGLTCRVQGHACIINTKSNKTVAFASYKTTVIHTVYCEARLNFMNCCLYGVHAGEIDYKLILFSDKAWFLLSGYVNPWKNRLPTLVHKMPLHVCGMLRVQWWLWGPVCFWDNKFTLTHIQMQFFEHLCNYETICVVFHQSCNCLLYKQFIVYRMLLVPIMSRRLIKISVF